MKVKHILFIASIICFSSCIKQSQPNILMIAVDDMNNYIGAWGGQAITPNIDRLASEGTMFRNAYCVVPACNPSRTALLTGQRPETTGQYQNEGNFRDRNGGQERITLPQYLQSLGYESIAAGKIFHYPRGNEASASSLSDSVSWNAQRKGYIGTPGEKAFLGKDGYGAWQQGAANDYLVDVAPGTNYMARCGIWGAIKETLEECADWKSADYCANYLQKNHKKPFFLSLGIFRPHSPQLAPQEFFDLYDKDAIELPELPENDMDDIPQIAQKNFAYDFVQMVRNKGELRNAMHGYLASMSFADACVGHVLDALKKSKYADNTIIIFWTDHGFQLAQKNRWEKFSLWDLSTNAPMIIKKPKQNPTIVNTKVSLLDIYPTIVDLLDKKQPAFLEGNSLCPLLDNPETAWKNAAIVTFGKGNHSVQFENWNYIVYEDGSEELYNHDNDPKEFNNLASDTNNKTIITQLKSKLSGLK